MQQLLLSLLIHTLTIRDHGKLEAETIDVKEMDLALVQTTYNAKKGFATK